MRWKLFVCCMSFFLLLTACSNPPTTNKESVKGDGGAKTPKCSSPRDCEELEDCIGGKCVPAKECLGYEDCEDGLRCFEGRCIKMCNVDPECPEGHVCNDGVCHKPNWKKGKAPNEGSTTRKEVKAGLGVVPLDHPMGVSMAGFGFRSGGKTPYAKSLGSSTGMFDRFEVKALVLDDGVERFAIVRSPLVFTTDFLVTQVVQEIIKREGIDFSGKILVNSTHSHSAPARFWNILPGLGFGAFGGGSFHPEIFRRLVRSFADAVIKANKNLIPAKMGYAVDLNFDPKSRIFSDRRGLSPHFRFNHLLVLRVDKMDGSPLAVLVSFPMHGIINPFESSFLSNDASGGLEFKLQDRLEAKSGKRVEAFFLQGCAGDISPRGDYLGHKVTQQMQMLGHLASEHIEKLYDSIKTEAKIELEIVNKRIPISRKLIGYKDNEFVYVQDGKRKPYRFGAFKCVEKGKKEEIYKDGELQCAFSVELLHGGPVPQFAKTHLTALKIGKLVLASLPGESTSFLGKKLYDEALKQSGGKIKDLFVLGYAQDHHLYLLMEKDWWHGGYEASMSVWGPKFGEYVLKHAIPLVLQLTTPEKEKNDTKVLPQDFYKLDLSVTIPRKKTPDAGKILREPAKYHRLAPPMRFSFLGGHLGVDNPRVVLQKKTGSGFEDVKRTGGRLYDDTDFRITQEFYLDKTTNSYEFAFFFEELENFPTGTYRFRIEGTKWDGSKRIPYKSETKPFEVVPSEDLRVRQVILAKDKITGWVMYPPATNDDGKSRFDSIKQRGHRLRSTIVHRNIGTPLPEKGKTVVSITISQGGKDIEKLSAEKLNLHKVITHRVVKSRDDKGVEKYQNQQGLGSGFELKLKQALKPGKYQVKIEVTDPHQNTGKWTKELEVK